MFRSFSYSDAKIITIQKGDWTPLTQHTDTTHATILHFILFTTQDVVHLVSSVLEDYSPPYSHGIADAAARELLSAAIEQGAQGGIAAVVVLVPWTHPSL